MSDDKQQVGRLALRVEGDWWVAYYALPDTMQGAFELSRIRMSMVGNPERKQGFLSLMRDILADIMQEQLGIRPDMNAPVAAPEHERAGRA